MQIRLEDKWRWHKADIKPRDVASKSQDPLKSSILLIWQKESSNSKMRPAADCDVTFKAPKPHENQPGNDAPYARANGCRRRPSLRLLFPIAWPRGTRMHWERFRGRQKGICTVEADFLQRVFLCSPHDIHPARVYQVCSFRGKF